MSTTRISPEKEQRIRAELFKALSGNPSSASQANFNASAVSGSINDDATSVSSFDSETKRNTEFNRNPSASRDNEIAAELRRVLPEIMGQQRVQQQSVPNSQTNLSHENDPNLFPLVRPEDELDAERMEMFYWAWAQSPKPVWGLKENLLILWKAWEVFNHIRLTAEQKEKLRTMTESVKDKVIRFLPTSLTSRSEVDVESASEQERKSDSDE